MKTANISIDGWDYGVSLGEDLTVWDDFATVVFKLRVVGQDFAIARKDGRMMGLASDPTAEWSKDVWREVLMHLGAI